MPCELPNNPHPDDDPTKPPERGPGPLPPINPNKPIPV